MKRYHFDIGGGAGVLGLAGSLFAKDDDEALAILQEILDDHVDEHTVVDRDGGREPKPADVPEARVSYVNVYTNGMTATMQMFDEIDDVEQPSSS